MENTETVGRYISAIVHACGLGLSQRKRSLLNIRTNINLNKEMDSCQKHFLKVFLTEQL